MTAASWRSSGMAAAAARDKRRNENINVIEHQSIGGARSSAWHRREIM